MQRQLVGVVTRDQNSKTRRVEVARLYRHPKYGKIVRARTICYAHDENNVSVKGDTVEIVECRPRSRTKRWELVRVVQTGNRAPAVSETVEAAV
ncbi:MAG: 30S ribosomal protein S17 [Planctomycetaceae bacterium]|jgi:small subunit ribosomal protein S17